MSMALEVMKLIFPVLDVSFNSGHNTVIIIRQFLYVNICSFSTKFIYMLAFVHCFAGTKPEFSSNKIMHECELKSAAAPAVCARSFGVDFAKCLWPFVLLELLLLKSSIFWFNWSHCSGY